VSEATAAPPGQPGLRERKKARTRAALQEHALRLFARQGYGETTIEQIAEAAEVSPATVYRYFPTKADLVIYDDLDDRLIEAFRAQPPELGALQAMRAAVSTGFRGLFGDALQVQRDRERLIRTEPELRSAMFDELTRTIREVTGMISERTGQPPDDDAVLALAGAILGVTMAAWFASEGDLDERFLRRFDAAMAALETGFRW